MAACKTPYRLLHFLTSALVMYTVHADLPQLRTETPGVATGTLMSFVSSFEGGRDVATHYLTGDQGQMYRLTFCDGIDSENLLPNIRVRISYTRIADGVMYTCQPPQELQSAQSQPPSRHRHRQARRLLYGDTIDAPTEPTFLVYITTFCGFSGEAGATPQAVYDMFGVNDTAKQGDSSSSSNATSKITMASYYDTCSYGRVAVRPLNVRVIGPIEIPCTAVLDLPYTFPSGNSLDTRSCGRDNMLKWQYYLDAIAVRKYGIVPTDYHHKIMILPKTFTAMTPDCNSFTGQASVGPSLRTYSSANNWGTGLVWLAGEAFAAPSSSSDGTPSTSASAAWRPSTLEALFHELGHNLGMAHADVAGGGCGGQDQCDNTCAMGARGGQGIRCWNAPHMWQLGWGRPFRQLRDADLARGVPQRITLPPHMSSRTSSVQVALAGPGIDPDLKLFLSARINAPPYDLPFPAAQDGQPFLTLHAYSGSPANLYRRTILLATLAPGQTFIHNATGLVVAFTDWQEDASGQPVPSAGKQQQQPAPAQRRQQPAAAAQQQGSGQQQGPALMLGGSTSASASAVLCRRQGAREQVCGDDVDDDCDFLPDHLDPDCEGRMPSASASASPSPSTPPGAKPSPLPSPLPSPSPSPVPSPSPSPSPGASQSATAVKVVLNVNIAQGATKPTPSPLPLLPAPQRAAGVASSPTPASSRPSPRPRRLA